MHPSIARGAMQAFTTAVGDTVVDPFCGSGTMLVEAMGLGRRAFGVDASPLGIAIARVRSNALGDEGRDAPGRGRRRASPRSRAISRASGNGPMSRAGRAARSRASIRTCRSSCWGCARW